MSASPPTNPSPIPPPGDGASKAYQPAAVEPRILAKWNASGAFRADPQRVLSGERDPFCILIPPPNVTGALHLGHALNNTLQDVLTRAHRMMGYETLWIVGTDHAGIATQAVVERRLKKEQGKSRKDFTREQFVAKVQEWKDEYEQRITGQLKAMGCSCDFDRQRFTMDPICARAVREAFFRLFKDGLIYRGKRLVNWDPVLQTAVADDECYEEEVDSSFYYLRYPLVHTQSGTKPGSDPQPVTWNELATRGYPGADQHPGEQPAWVTVATTRPETYLGDTAVAVSPKDHRAKSLRGLFVELPLVGRVIPIVEDDYVVLPAAQWADPEEAKNDPKAQYATGFLKVTPAHDQNDYELGIRHKLPMVNVFAPDATISDKHGWSDAKEVEGAHVFLHKSREDARKLVIREFEARGLLEKPRPYKHSVKFSDRSKAVIEPYLSDQWYVRVTNDRLAGAANRALVPEQRTTSPERQRAGSKTASQQPVPHAPSSSEAGDGSMRFYPARYAKTYEQWHDNIRDWCISRQLWWGHRIPVWSKRVNLTKATFSQELQSSQWSGGPTFGDLIAKGDAEVGIRCVHVATGREEFIKDLAPPHDLLQGEYDIYVCALSDAAIARWRIENAGFSRDPDVLDTWFSSALWPLSTLGWPEPSQSAQTASLLEAFNPTSVLSTAREIITLWVSRMVMMNRYLLPPPETRDPNPETRPAPSGPIPFHDVFIHAVVQDGEGRKMSKSLNNGVDPLDIIESHGADAMRFTLAQMTTQTQDVRMPVKPDPKTGKNTSDKFDAGRNFCNKLWNASRFAMSILDRNRGPGASPGTGAPNTRHDPVHGLAPTPLSLTDRWLMSRLAKAVRSCEQSLKNYEFADYCQTLYQLLWWDYCDWYLEAIKPTVDKDPGQRAVLRTALDVIIRLLHPVAPFITETVHEQLRSHPAASVAGIDLRSADLLCTSSWPAIDAALIDETAEKEFEELREIVTSIRNVRSEHQVLPKRRITLHCSDAAAKRITSAAPGLVENLAGLEAITPAKPAAGTQTVAFRAGGEEMFLSNLADAIDAGAEKDRLTKQRDTLVKSETALNGRLSNPGYVDKAPPKLVEESKAQLEKIRAEIAAIEAKLKTL